MTAILLALVSAAVWGTADFMGGQRARTLSVVSVMVVAEGAGLLMICAWIAIGGIEPPALERLLPALVGGLAGTLALAAFYRALAIGTMSIVAPISAIGAVVPVIAGLVGGDRPSAIQFAGMATALGGAVLVSRAEAGRAIDARRSLLLAFVAAAGFGTVLWLIKPAAAASVPWTLVTSRLGAVSLLLLAVLIARIDVRGALSTRHLGPLVLLGGLDLGANALYALATTKGLLAVVSVLGALYPVATIVLARVVLGERVRRSQEAGIVAVLGGVALIAAG